MESVYMENSYLSVSNRLRIYREKLNETQNSMGSLLGVTQSHYSRLEDGKKVISYQNLQHFRANGGDVQFLITGEWVKRGPIDEYLEKCRKVDDKEELLKLIIWAGRQGEQIENKRLELFDKSFLPKEIRNLNKIWKAIRINENLTQIEMASLLDINIKRYRRIEKNQVLPDADILYSLYMKLGYSPLIVMDSDFFYLNKLNIVWKSFSEKTTRQLDELIQKGIRCIQKHEKYTDY